MLCLFLLFGYLWGGPRPDLALVVELFIPVWLLVSVANMWIGVTKAGYTVRGEFPVLLIVFAVPTILAGVVAWLMSRA